MSLLIFETVAAPRTLWDKYELDFTDDFLQAERTVRHDPLLALCDVVRFRALHHI